jgi:hypothetical protein
LKITFGQGYFRNAGRRKVIEVKEILGPFDEIVTYEKFQIFFAFANDWFHC